MMKIVQTSWAGNQKNMFQFNAGWISPEYHLMGWALSCLQLRKFYDNVVLHADTVVSKMLIDTLQLPYTEVICDLDQFTSNPSALWAMAKIHSYSQQTEPFLHVDGDVFIWEPFDDQLMTGGLIAQNLEIATSVYENMFDNLDRKLTYFPPEISEKRKGKETIYAYNAGILGGNDLAFFKLYTQKAKEFVTNNTHLLANVNLTDFNIYFEQYLFYCLTLDKNKKVNVLFEDIIPDNGYVSFGDFTEVPHNKKYLHLIGIYKRVQNVCQQLANRLRQDYPEYYYRIIALFRNKQIPLKKDYYYFCAATTEQSLIARYHILKSSFDNIVPIKENDEDAPNVEITAFRTKMVENAIKHDLNCMEAGEVNNNYTNQLNDIKKFERKLSKIIKYKFSKYSKDYLYARDISHTKYFQYIFADENFYNKTIAIDSVIEIVKSQFDWTYVDGDDINAKKIIFKLKDEPSTVYTCVIPECTAKGYSVINVDNLDMYLLQILKKPLSIREVLNQAMLVFDGDDVENSSADFELLITGRIKLALQAKIVKVAY